MAYYLGIDGGGSKTTCVVGDDSSILSCAVAGPSNITRVGEGRARESLHRAITEACGAAKISPLNLHRTCLGVSGAGRKEIAARIRAIAAELIAGEIEVVGDMEIALQCGIDSGHGVIVIAGTGSIAYGRDGEGKTARAGGWGFSISDEGSAHWIGRMAVAAMLRGADLTSDATSHRAIAQTSLFREMRAVWAFQTLEQMARMANSNADFAVLFPAVLAAADGEDAVAQAVLTQAGRELAQLAGIVVSHLFAGSNIDVPVAMVGGVFRHASIVRDVFYNELRAVHQQVVLNPKVLEPVDGALQLARKSAV